MTTKELEKYCIKEAIRCIGRANDSKGEERAHYQGRAKAFMWIAGMIQNEVTEK